MFGRYGVLWLWENQIYVERRKSTFGYNVHYTIHNNPFSLPKEKLSGTREYIRCDTLKIGHLILLCR